MQSRSILLAVTASFFFASSTFLSKLLGSGVWGEPLHPLQITHSRFAFGLITALMLFLLLRRNFTKPHYRLHFLRSSCGWAGVAILFTGILYIPASDAVALTFLNPIFAMIFAVLFLKESVGIHRWTTAIIALLGGIMLIRPDASGLNPIALLCIAGAMIIGVEIIAIKLLATREDVFQILVVNNAIAAALASMPLFVVFEMPSALQWFALSLVGAVMVTGQMLFLFAMRASDASLVAPFIYATLIFVGGLDFIILGVHPDCVSLVGGGLILASGSYIAIRERLQQDHS